MDNKDIKFLLDCANIEEFEVQCALASIDMKEAVKALSFFDEDGKYCIALDHFYWFDENGQQIDAPQEVNNNFDCSHCNQLTSLEGSPQKVNGNFDCADCTSLTSLKGAPEEADRNFWCDGCTSLTSLEGAPQEVGESFSCSNCRSLTSLEGAPQQVNNRGFYCSNCISLTSLEGGPQKVNGNFWCDGCTSLTSLEGAPRKVYRDFQCDYCNSLTSLEGAPQKVNGDFNCSNCTSLTSLEGAPREVHGIFFCKFNSISTKQFAAYEKWLKTNPSQQYHDPFAKKKTNESMTSIDNFIYAICNEDAEMARTHLKSILESKCKRRLAEILLI